jgi:predicted RNA-binding protein YlqC (UPF0109 family)
MERVDGLDSRGELACDLLLKMTRALVDHPGDVSILRNAEADGATFTIQVHPDDIALIIGAQRRNARSLPILVSGIRRKLGRRFAVIIDEDPFARGRVRAELGENLPV